MHPVQEPILGHELTEAKEAEHEDDSNREPQQQPLILSVEAKDLAGTYASPEGRGR